MARAFISYSRDDRDKAAALAAAIEDYGHEVWWDIHLVGGDQFQDVIEDKLSQVDAIIVLWTESSIRKPWVLAEATLGLERDCLIPVQYDTRVSPPKAFKNIHVEFLGGWNGKKRAPEIGKLVERINDLKYQRDHKRRVEALPVALTNTMQKSGFLGALFDSALPGGLRVYEFVLGSLLTALGLWALVHFAHQLAGNLDEDDPLDLVWAFLAAAGIAASRAIDQYIAARKKRSFIRFFDRTFSQACAVSALLVIIGLAGLYLLSGSNLTFDVQSIDLLTQIWLSLLVLGYAVRLILLITRSLVSRV